MNKNPYKPGSDAWQKGHDASNNSKWLVTYQSDTKLGELHQLSVYAPTIYEALAIVSARPYGHRAIAIELQDS